MAASLGTVKFADRDGNRRVLTIRSLPVGVVQALEGLVNACPQAHTIEIVLRAVDDGELSRVTISPWAIEPK